MIHGPKKTVAVRIPMELYLEISRLAKETHRTIPGYIRHVLIIHIYQATNRNHGTK